MGGSFEFESPRGTLQFRTSGSTFDSVQRDEVRPSEEDRFEENPRMWEGHRFLRSANFASEPTSVVNSSCC
jgi:hypothetical protein